MSSAANHRKRSHRSYHDSVSTLESFQRKQIVKTQNRQTVKAKKSLVGMFINAIRRKTPENKTVKNGGNEK